MLRVSNDDLYKRTTYPNKEVKIVGSVRHPINGVQYQVQYVDSKSKRWYHETDFDRLFILVTDD